MTQREDPVRIVLGIHDPSGTYARHAGVVMASFFSNTQSRVVVHILHDGTLTPQNRARLVETANGFGQEVRLVDVTEDLARLGNTALRTAGSFLSVGCLFRLLIPELLPYGKVIYMDCDVLVNLDIRKLWDINIDEYCIAGVLDSMAKKNRSFFSKDYIVSRIVGFDLTNYVNSGVLAMNLEKIRATCDLPQEAAGYFARYAHCSPPVDQNFINAVFHGKCLILDPRFNRNSAECHDERAVLHVMGKPKPWEGFNEEFAGRLYWGLYAQTAWKDEILNAVLDAAFHSPLNHRKTSQCYGKISRRLRKDLGFGGAAGLWRLLAAEIGHRFNSLFKKTG